MVVSAIEKVQPLSSPGFPLMRLGTTNAKVLENHSDLVIDIVSRRLALLNSYDPKRVKDYDADELIARNLTDEVRIFVKNELHGRQKVRQGRMRLIMSVSLIDQLVERVLNSAQNSLEIQSWQTIPSKPGLGLHDEGLLSLRAQIDSMPHPVASDVSGFDWSVAQWMLDLDARARGRLIGPAVSRALENRATCLGLSRFVYSDGTSCAQMVSGVQKSGSYNTSGTNSRIRATLAAIAAFRRNEEPAVMTMGDDAVEGCVDISSLPPSYDGFGVRLKQLSREIEFCSYVFHSDGRFEPVRWHKMLASLLASRPKDRSAEDELLCALRHELRHSPHLSRAMEVIRAVGWGCVKRD